MFNFHFLTRTVQLRHPGLVEAAEDGGVVPGDHLVLGQPETVAAGPAVVLVPAVRTVERVLGQDGGQQGENNQISHLTGSLYCSVEHGLISTSFYSRDSSQSTFSASTLYTAGLIQFRCCISKCIRLHNTLALFMENRDNYDFYNCLDSRLVG